MASNCPHWRANRCAPPGMDSGHDCSWPDRDYASCGVYKMAIVRNAGGSMEDALRAAGALPPGATVVGGSGRRFGDADLRRMTGGGSRKRWWEFWK